MFSIVLSRKIAFSSITVWRSKSHFIDDGLLEWVLQRFVLKLLWQFRNLFQFTVLFLTVAANLSVYYEAWYLGWSLLAYLRCEMKNCRCGIVAESREGVNTDWYFRCRVLIGIFERHQTEGVLIKNLVRYFVRKMESLEK